MNAVILNASPKTEPNNSGYFAGETAALLRPDVQTQIIRVNRPALDGGAVGEIARADVILFCFPLYVDQIPSHLLHVMEQLEAPLRAAARPGSLYALINCGFYEGVHNELAVEILENWALACGLRWNGAVGIGGGEMLGSMPDVPPGAGPKKDLGAALQVLSGHIKENTACPFIAVNSNFPKHFFKMMANLGFRMTAKKNGLRRGDLTRMPR